MKKSLFFALAALGIIGAAPANAQQPAQAFTVATCGTLPAGITYAVSTYGIVTMDTNGKLCDSGSGGGGGTVTANQGTAAAITAGWPVTDGAGADTTGTFTGTGAATVNAPIDGYGSAKIQIKGTYAGFTVNTLASSDNGTTFVPLQCATVDGKQLGTAFVLTANQSLEIACGHQSGDDTLQLQTSAGPATGTANVDVSPSSFPSDDGNTTASVIVGPTGNYAAVKAASTAPLSTDPALVTTISPNSAGIIATGTAGTPSSQVLSTQGVSGGTPTPVSGPTADGSAASTNPVLIAGTSDGTGTGAVAIPKITAGGVASTDLSTVNATTVLTGSGAVGAGSQRVAVGTDTATIAGSAPGAVGAPNAFVGTSGGYFNNVASSTLTRIANTTPYAANQTVCLFTSVTVCAPITISIATANAGKGLINRISLLKSGTSTTNASFTVWLFSAAPGTATPNQFDATSYTGPRAADLPNYIGNAVCNAPTVTSDSTVQVWYDCTLSNPNTGGALDFQALSGATTIDALISTGAAYTPASGETFKVYASGIY